MFKSSSPNSFDHSQLSHIKGAILTPKLLVIATLCVPCLLSPFIGILIAFLYSHNQHPKIKKNYYKLHNRVNKIEVHKIHRELANAT